MEFQIIIILAILAIIGFVIYWIGYRYLQYGKHLNYNNYHIVRISQDKYAIRRGFIFKKYYIPRDRWILPYWVQRNTKEFFMTLKTLEECEINMSELMDLYGEVVVK